MGDRPSTGCSASATGATFDRVSSPRPVPVDLVTGGLQLTEPRLDSSGRWLAYVESDAAGSRFVVVDLDDDGSSGSRIVTDPAPAAGRGMGGGAFAWLPDASGLVFAGSDGSIWRVSTSGGDPESVWCGTGAQAPAVSPDGRRVAFMVDQRDIVVASLDGGDPVVVTAAAGPDFAFDPVFAPDGASVTFQGWSVPDMAWDAAARYSHPVGIEGALSVERLDGAAIQQPGFLPDGAPVAVSDVDGWLNVSVGDRPIVAEPFEHAGPTWGPGQRTWAASPDGRRIAFTRNEAGFGRLVVADVATGELITLGRAVHGQLSWAGRRVAALRSGARTPTEIVVYEESDSGDWSRRRISRGPADGWTDHEWVLVEPDLVEVPDGDGTVLHARRYASPSPCGRLLVWIHGGPTAQWDVSFNPGVAFWCSRGWDVLLVDPRGSTGHGRRYQQALRGGWGVLDVEDTATMLEHAHADGRSTPPRTVVMGGSSGGLTVLGVLGRHAGLVAGGVALYPVSDIHDLNEHSHRFEAHYQLSLVGPDDTAADRQRYWDRSPQSYADRIASPLLVLHGTDDPVVPVDQSCALARRIRQTGGRIELHLIDAEGHGFRRPESKQIEYRLVEAFLDRLVPPEDDRSSGE
jgi:dipeptidyl aminopeptidase/acylaminoacyl peptidase